MGRIISMTADQLANRSVQERLSPLGHEFIAEAGYPEPFNPEHFYPFWQTLLSQNIGAFFVAEEDAEPVGVMGCLFVQDTFSGVRTGLEHFWFVSKSARSGARLGLALFNEFERECDERDCRFRLMMHLDGLRDGALAEFYKRRGYGPAERCFRKVV